MTALVFASMTGVFFGLTLSFLSLFLILLVLVQRGKGGGLTGALGGPGGQSAFGTKAGDMFTKITSVVALVWIFLCGASVFVMGNARPMVDNAAVVESPSLEGLDVAGEAVEVEEVDAIALPGDAEEEAVAAPADSEEPAMTEAPAVEAPKTEEPKADEPKPEAPKAEETKEEAPKTDEPKAEEANEEAPKADEPKVEEPKEEAPKAEEPKADAPESEESAK
ncbi:preprotein translocase subunit SecG [Rosistilla carotiformis]|uniref:Protein-export membrane protein SecG n=1 Tax=Rosistilla carotiformis TaxID=2528017 RepID=A0A518JSE3_9BACT|nr:preprotein translocase subunit SecG [Rosistilla carotiformis]QDV68463.1 preprotein translocase subunit SecG [Rosistilla carotiformis]